MKRQRCQAGRGELGPVELRRLVALQQLIGEQAVEQAVLQAGRTNRRHCRLTHPVVLWLVLAMGTLTDLPLREVFRFATRRRPGDRLPGRAALCRARQKLGVAPVRRLFAHVVRPLARPDRPGGFYRGLRLVGIDGTVYDVPDSPANARVFGRPRTGRDRAAFPQVRKLSLVELGTHAELALVLKPCHVSEGAMVAGLLRHLGPGTLLLGDRYFLSTARWRELTRRGVQVLFRAKAGRILAAVEGRADGSYLAKLYDSHYDRLKDRRGLLVRVIRYTLDDPQRVGHGEEHVLVTTLLDAERHPARELVVLYHERWEHELTYDEQKTHQGPRQPGKEAQVRSETPAGVVQELYALSLGHYAVRALMAEAGARVDLDPDRLSFVGCVRILRLRLPECVERGPVAFRCWYEALLEEMSQERLPARANRVNPRVVKRKMSRFPKKRPHHRPTKRLGKKFVETVVIET